MTDFTERYRALTGKIAAVTVALDERDENTREHCDRVCGLALDLGRKCGLSPRELNALQLAAVFHDVGKIGIPDRILKAPRKLTQDEWWMMQTHSVRSERIIISAHLEDSELVALAVRHHHERFDGTGYPDKLAGESIPILSRIIAVVDAYDAMSALRHYGPLRGHTSIMAELRRWEGEQHDAQMIRYFERIIEHSPHRAVP
jgi:HD-GYP domain-containing protein (c-di-GMP phosphodiesterase class II)